MHREELSAFLVEYNPISGRPFTPGVMKDPRALQAATGLLGLVAGAGVCYCLYRVASGRKKKGGGGTAPAVQTNGVETVQKEHQAMPPAAAPGSRLLQQVSRISVVSSTAQGESKNPAQGMGYPKSTHNLDACHIQELIRLLQFSEDPSVQEQVLVTLSNSAAFSVNQDIIRNLGGLSVVGKMLSVPDTKVKEKALNALNNLSMNITNQEELKMYINKVCEEIEFSDLNSELQLAGLRFLTNMSITNNYHYMMTSSIPCFLRLLLEGNERTQVQVLKVLVNLSVNPFMADHLLHAQAPFLLSLFDSCLNKDVLLRVLVFATNLTQHVPKSTVEHHQYTEDSLFSALCENSAPRAQKLASLLHHCDTEVKEQVTKLLMQQPCHQALSY